MRSRNSTVRVRSRNRNIRGETRNRTFRGETRNSPKCQTKHHSDSTLTDRERGYRLIETGGEGSCLFYALAWGLRDGTNLPAALARRHSMEMRNKIVSYVYNHWDDEVHGITWSTIIQEEYSDFGISSKFDYARIMGKHETFAGEPEILAAHNCLGRNINVFECRGRAIIPVHRFVRGDDSPINVARVNKNHYMAFA